MKSFDSIASKFLAGVIGIAALTTLLGRSNSPRVIDSLGNAGANLVNASLGANANLR